MNDRQPNPYPALRPGPVYPGPIYSMSPWAIYGGGTYPGYMHPPCTMGGGVVPNLNDTCGWTYKQWGPGMGGTYPSYSYKNYFPQFVPGLNQPGLNTGRVPVSVGAQYNPVAVGDEASTAPAPTSDAPPESPGGFRQMLGSRFGRGRPKQATQLTAPLTPPQQPLAAAPSEPKRSEPDVVGDLTEGRDNVRKPIVLDVRSVEEAAIIPTIPGATNVPIAQLPYHLRALVKAAGSAEHPVAVYCKLGKRAELAKQFLEAAGFENVTNLGGTHSGPNTDVLSWGRPVEPQAVTLAQLAGAA